ncbi:hypothetical protein ACFL96_18090 [Thermoproteota archaeon]
MKIIDLSTEREKLRSFYRVVGFVSLVIIIITTIYGVVASIIQGVNVVGETLVTLEVPPISVFPLFYSKPITWLSASLFALFFSALELGKDDVLKWSKPRRDILKFIAFFVGSMAAYEVMFNFTLWGGLIASDSILGELNVDLIKNTFPNPNTPWNIVFATKLFTVVMIISSYAFYYLQKIESKIEKRL